MKRVEGHKFKPATFQLYEQCRKEGTFLQLFHHLQHQGQGAEMIHEKHPMRSIGVYISKYITM